MRIKQNLGITIAVMLIVSLAGCGEDIPAITPNEDWKIPENSYTLSDRIMYVKDFYDEDTGKGYLTGANAYVDTTQFGIGATDLGFSFYDDELGRLYTIFGDTNTTSPAKQNGWESNATLYTDNLDFSNGVEWQGALKGQNGAYLQVTPITQAVASRNGYSAMIDDISSSAVTTTIPTGAVVIDGIYYIFYMEVDSFLDTGEWGVYSNKVVKSSDQGETWHIVEGLEWVARNADGSSGIAPNFAQIYPFLDEDGYVYIYGIPAGRSGGVQLGRVKKENFEDFEAYEYFRKLNDDGTPDWRQGANGLKIIKNYTQSFIVSPSCGELCITYNAYLQRYTMYYLMNNSSIVVRRSVNPWGSWSSTDVITNQSKIDGLYGGFTHSALTTDEGRRTYLFVSQWYPTYNVHLLEIVYN